MDPVPLILVCLIIIIHTLKIRDLQHRVKELEEKLK
jgi:hypothetical protein